jgi:prepilin-type N-terminal cleavage/methylation domain-containing protein
MCSRAKFGYSLFEVMIALLIFSLAISIISTQVEIKLDGITAMQQRIAKIYRDEV